jgi:hypothetical protein
MSNGNVSVDDDSNVSVADDGHVPVIVIYALTAFLAALAILGFAALSIYGFVETFKAHASPPTLNAAYLYVMAALSALVGGIVAVAFGQKAPAPAPMPLAQRNARALSSVITIGRDVGSIIGSVYAITYVVLGAAAVVVWIIKSNVVADPIKALAATFIGLAIPIIRGYFT